MHGVSRKRRVWKIPLIVTGTAGLLLAITVAAFKLSPWPHVWIIRDGFNRGAAAANASLAPLLPDNVSARYGVSYSAGERDAVFDVFFPDSSTEPLPAVVWVHGGGFVAGSRSDLSNYLQILAARGFVTVAIDYTLAPSGRFPKPVLQTNAALAYLVAHAHELHIDPRRIFLAGDSAGAQIAAQTALVISDPRYSARMGIAPGLEREALRGLLLYCGPYEPTRFPSAGELYGFKKIVMWSYMGTRDMRDERMAGFSVTPHLSALFPPVFISVGNADSLAPQSVDFATALRRYGVEVDALFFPEDYDPPLGHEYQMLLTTDAGRLAFERSITFLTTHALAPADNRISGE
jgi:acetyl esterase/lipase